MKRKSLHGGRAAPATSTKPSQSHSTVRAIPLLVTKDEDHAGVLKASIKGNHDVRNVRGVSSKDNVDNGINEVSSKSPHYSLGREYISIDFLDRKICISCNKGGEVLVCSERDCPVAIHAKCICCKPKFDDRGNFYCSYCWLKRALAEVQELGNKALIAKKDLSNFLDKNVIASNKPVQKYGAAKRKEPKELSLVGNGSCLDYRNGQGNDSIHSQPLQTEEDQEKEMKEVTAGADRLGTAVEGEAHADSQAANTVDSGHYREEKTLVQNELVHKCINTKKFDVHKISEIYETRFVEGKGETESEDPRYNEENVHKRIVEDGEAEPLSASCLRKYTNGHSPDIAFVKGTQESVAVSGDNGGRKRDRERVLQNELKVPATSSSVGETNDSGSEAHSVKKRHVKHRAQKFPERVSSVGKSLSLNRNTEGQNVCDENEGATSSKTLGQALVPFKQGCSKKLTIPTGKRKRLRWTAEEEKVLKEGVLRFSAENHQIPWRKILEFGCHVFDDTRTPVDLKDKWRNIIAKEG